MALEQEWTETNRENSDSLHGQSEKALHYTILALEDKTEVN